MNVSRVLSFVSLCALLPFSLVGCGGEDEIDPIVEECEFACEGFSDCEGEVMTVYPLYFDVDTCIEEFCQPGDTLIDPRGRGDAACDASLLAYLDCVNAMTCEDWDASDVVGVFAGSGAGGAAGCEAEANDFVLDCLALLP